MVEVMALRGFKTARAMAQVDYTQALPEIPTGTVKHTKDLMGYTARLVGQTYVENSCASYSKDRPDIY